MLNDLCFAFITFNLFLISVLRHLQMWSVVIFAMVMVIFVLFMMFVCLFLFNYIFLFYMFCSENAPSGSPCCVLILLLRTPYFILHLYLTEPHITCLITWEQHLVVMVFQCVFLQIKLSAVHANMARPTSTNPLKNWKEKYKAWRTDVFGTVMVK